MIKTRTVSDSGRVLSITPAMLQPVPSMVKWEGEYTREKSRDAIDVQGEKLPDTIDVPRQKRRAAINSK